jgi:hypothetical protein
VTKTRKDYEVGILNFDSHFRKRWRERNCNKRPDQAFFETKMRKELFLNLIQKYNFELKVIPNFFTVLMSISVQYCHSFNNIVERDGQYNKV